MQMITLGVTTAAHQSLVEQFADFESMITWLSALHHQVRVLRACGVDQSGNIVIEV
jgi:hypothetical protein